MKYFLFLNHPKGEKIYNVSREREEICREHFKRVDILETQVEIRGEKYEAVVDYSAFSNLANFDCFNCQDPCCADSPVIYEEKTREFVLDNLQKYNDYTKNIEIQLEMGNTFESTIESIKYDKVMVPEEYEENEISLCTCSFKPNNKSVLCSLHAICLDKGLSSKEIVEIKPIVCSLWPIDIIIDENKKLYITVPDDFTTGFTIEDYYDTPCVNKELSLSSTFRRKNPEGFMESEYKPIIVAYADTIKESLGEEFFCKVKAALIHDGLVEENEFCDDEKQILKRI